MKNVNESTDLLRLYDVASSMTMTGTNINGHKLWKKITDKAMTYPVKGQKRVESCNTTHKFTLNVSSREKEWDKTEYSSVGI